VVVISLLPPVLAGRFKARPKRRNELSEAANRRVVVADGRQPELGIDGYDTGWRDNHRVQVHFGDLGNVLGQPPHASEKFLQAGHVNGRRASIAEEER
jgi:hypothetical protein